MSQIQPSMLQRIAQHAEQQPTRPALITDGRVLDYQHLQAEVQRMAKYLMTKGYTVIAVDIDNVSSWAVIDLAALGAGICVVPLAPFFSNQQRLHALRQAGVQVVFSDRAATTCQGLGGVLARNSEVMSIANQTLTILPCKVPGVILPPDVIKITFTSGTTGEPKGAMLRWAQIEGVVQSLVNRVQADPRDRHLALLPLAVLLENLAGLYLPLWVGASVILPGLEAVGLSGSVGLDASFLLAAIARERPSSLITTPQSLQRLVEVLEAQPQSFDHLRFVAVGGAPVSPRLLKRAESLGLPIFEGYGLSECASVVSLNGPADCCPGSVGRPLPHVQLQIADDGEILVRNHGFAGYLGDERTQKNDAWHTGDLGYLDDQGYLHLKGRRRNVFITSMGRNVAPEWVERELVVEPEILQAAVFGESRPRNVAVLVPHPQAGKAAVSAAIERVNLQLPDYARISHYHLADQAFTPMNGQLTGTGRLRRERVEEIYREPIETFFRKEYVL